MVNAIKIMLTLVVVCNIGIVYGNDNFTINNDGTQTVMYRFHASTGSSGIGHIAPSGHAFYSLWHNGSYDFLVFKSDSEDTPACAFRITDQSCPLGGYYPIIQKSTVYSYPVPICKNDIKQTFPALWCFSTVHGKFYTHG